MSSRWMFRNPPRPLLAGLVLWALASAASRDASAAPPVWRYTAPPAQQRVAPSTVKLPSGVVLVMGGYLNGTGLPPLKIVERYHPETDSWVSMGPLGQGRYLSSASLLADGRILVAGGLPNPSGGGNARTASAEIYDPATGTSTPAASMNIARYAHSSVLLPDGRVLVVGDDNTSEVYNPATNTWTWLQPFFSEGKNSARLVLLPSGKVLMVCGEYTEEPKLFNPATSSWTSTGPMGTRRQMCTATLLANGKVLVTGGYIYPTGWNSPLATAELYDPATNTWSAAAPMSQARRGHAAGLLPGGKVLVAGGWSGSTYLASAEVYDPATNTWQVTASMGWSRYSYGFLLHSLRDGNLFVGSDRPEFYVSGLDANDLGSALGNSLAQGDTCGRPNEVAPVCAASSAPDLTYSWKAPAAGTFTFTTAGSAYDTVLQVSDAQAGTTLACNDDTGGTFQSSVTVSLTAGQAVRLAVDGYKTRCGAFTLNIRSGSALQSPAPLAPEP